MRLQGVDLRQLRVFLAVVDCGGFSAAEDVLGLAQSTISQHVADLEKRLGYRLCDRGRAGFLLTDRGRELHSSTVRVLSALDDFEEEALALKGRLAGRLRLALIDNMISDPNCRIAQALSVLDGSGRAPRITVEVLRPSEIENAVAVGRMDVGISITDRRLSSLAYTPLYRERDILVCGAGHPLFDVADERDLRQGVRSAPKVVRTFLNQHDFAMVSDRDDLIGGTVTNVEAAAFLILAGSHVGFLPEHYARRWIEAGTMRPMLPDVFHRTSEIVMISRHDGDAVPPVVRCFLDAMLSGTATLPSDGPMPVSGPSAGSAVAARPSLLQEETG